MFLCSWQLILVSLPCQFLDESRFFVLINDVMLQESFMDLDFDKLVEHSRVEHGITILSFLSKTLVFPVQIYHYLCRACGFDSLSKELFDMHMKVRYSYLDFSNHYPYLLLEPWKVLY